MVTAGKSAKESSSVLKLGVSGIILKHNSPVLLATAIRRVASANYC
jgi:DNA-binding NarL/FixJ family response regulator